MLTSLKRYLVGNPISSEQAQHERLNNKTALAVFSSDPLSSVAYSTEAMPPLYALGVFLLHAFTIGNDRSLAASKKCGGSKRTHY